MCEKGNCRTNVAFDHSYSGYSLCKCAPWAFGVAPNCTLMPASQPAITSTKGGSFSDSTEGSPRYKYGTSTRWEVVTPQSMSVKNITFSVEIPDGTMTSVEIGSRKGSVSTLSSSGTVTVFGKYAYVQLESSSKYPTGVKVTYTTSETCSYVFPDIYLYLKCIGWI